MKVLVVGLGSMGKRRIRNLLALGRTQITGFDVREDRRNEAEGKYGIRTYDEFERAVALAEPDTLIISTSPQAHMQYANYALENALHAFIEASVVDGNEILRLYESSRGKGLVLAPSCTMRYFPGPRRVKELIRSGAIGEVWNLNYQTGQYLPDWHPWERIEDYYVSRRETGGCREIVPFELTWLNDIFGDPEPLSLVKDKLSRMDADIDDIYHLLLRYPGRVLANITIEVLSRPIATRELTVIGSEGRLVMSALDNSVRYINVSMSDWHRTDLGRGTVENEYINPEEPYIEEMREFIAAVEEEDESRFPNSLFDDYKVLSTLNALEALAAT